MTHVEFVNAYTAGQVKATVDPATASKYLSARLMLPFFVIPVLGAGIALVLIGWIWAGLALTAIGFIAPRLIKRSAPQFVLRLALQNEEIYRDLTQAGILQIARD